MKKKELVPLFGNLKKVKGYCVEGIGMNFVLLHDPQEHTYFLGPNGYGFLSMHLRCATVPDAVIGITQAEHEQEMIIGIQYGLRIRLYCRVADQWNFQAELELPDNCMRLFAITRDWEGTGIWLLVSYEDADQCRRIAKYDNAFRLM